MESGTLIMFDDRAYKSEMASTADLLTNPFSDHRISKGTDMFLLLPIDFRSNLSFIMTDTCPVGW